MFPHWTRHWSFLWIKELAKTLKCKLIRICPCQRLWPMNTSYFFSNVFLSQPEEWWIIYTQKDRGQIRHKFPLEQTKCTLSRCVCVCDHRRIAHGHVPTLCLKQVPAFPRVLLAVVFKALWPPSTDLLSEQTSLSWLHAAAHFLTRLWFHSCLCCRVSLSCVMFAIQCIVKIY